GIIGLSRLLEAMPVPAEAQDLVRMIRSSGDALLRGISDVLDFAKVEAGKLDLEVGPFNLHRSIEESLGLFRTVAQEKGLRLECELAAELPVYVAGDDVRLRQVLLNLISNALKFTSSGEVVLRACVDRQEETSYCVAIEVRDTGRGHTVPIHRRRGPRTGARAAARRAAGGVHRQPGESAGGGGQRGQSEGRPDATEETGGECGPGGGRCASYRSR